MHEHNDSACVKGTPALSWCHASRISSAGYHAGVIGRLLDVGRSLAVGAAVGVVRTRPRRLRALDTSPFEAALATLAPGRDRDIGRVLDGASIATVQQLLEGGSLSSEELVDPSCRPHPSP